MSDTFFDTIAVERRGPVALMMLNRPERLNAINRAMVDEINRALDGLEGDAEVRALVLHGSGRAFSAGFDLKEGAAETRETEDDWRAVLQRDLDFILRFWDSPLPTIAAVHGHCLAGACELAMACDITVAAEGTLLGEPELRFGSGVVALLLPWLANPKRAKEVILTGNDKVTAAEAQRLGMVNRVVPDGTHLEAALEMARTIAVMDRDALALTKRAINETFEIMGLKRALAMGLETDLKIETMETPERRAFGEILRKEGLKAALAWRESRFA
ncbi:MAG: enoyl-CoA hydratase/isomerase family protein [Rhodospirillales bacterium]|nr:enoyl-CoA hydratase/isomerase family protein [Rhodospirillales bacterium]